jgi:hypothetical protein
MSPLRCCEALAGFIIGSKAGILTPDFQSDLMSDIRRVRIEAHLEINPVRSPNVFSPALG